VVEAGPAPSIPGVPTGGAFTFADLKEELRLVPETSRTIKVKIARGAAQPDEVVVTAVDLPSGVTADPLTIQGDASEGELKLNVAAATAKQGPYRATLKGVARKVESTTSLALFLRGKPGAIDTTFGTDGRARLPGDGATTDGAAIRVGGDDRIHYAHVCYQLPNPAAFSCVGRLRPDGSADPAFAYTNLGLSSTEAMLLDRTGGALVAGQISGGKPALVRVGPNGGLDAVFGTKNLGVGAPTPLAFGHALSQCPDGTVYVGFGANGYIGIERFTETGTRVPYFLQFIGLKWDESSSAAGIECDVGKSLRITGSYSGSGTGFAVGRLFYEGGVDYTFAEVGTKTWSYAGAGAVSSTVRALPDGRRLAGFDAADRPILVMFTADGRNLDVNFGVNGIVSLPLYPPGGGAHADGGLTSLHLLADGKVLVTLQGATDRVLRFTAGGSPDPTFGANGEVGLVRVRDATTRGVEVQSDGRIVIVSSGIEALSYVTRLWD
jgi:hypothetical protein